MGYGIYCHMHEIFVPHTYFSRIFAFSSTLWFAAGKDLYINFGNSPQNVTQRTFSRDILLFKQYCHILNDFVRFGNQ